MTRARLVHVTTTDISLALLLGPQLRAFADAGFEVVAMSAPGPYAARLPSLGARFVPLRHATRAMAPGQDALALAELFRVFRRLRPDIVHTHNPKPGVYGRVAARAAGVPAVVNTVHGLYALPHDPLPRRALVYGLEWMAAALSDAELVQNPEDVATLERLHIGRDRLHLLRNGVDLDRFRPGRVCPERRRQIRASFGAGEEDVVVGAVGRLVWEKGFRELFAAAGALAGRSLPCRVVVVGPADGDKADAVPEREIERARGAGVCFLGGRDDMEDLYDAMDLYVLASYREGFPRSAMEAAATGVPIVATDIRGCRQVVDDGATGLLVPVRDAAALAEGIAALVSDPARRRAMGRAARAKALREFDQQQVIATTLGVYETLLRRRRRPVVAV